MTEKTGLINDFVEIKVFIGDSREPIETTAYTKIRDLFESHLKESFNDPSNLKQYGIDVYKIKIGDKIDIFPSKWTLWFCKDKNIPLGDKYDFKYEVSDIKLEYYTKNPTHELELPLLEIMIVLKRL